MTEISSSEAVERFGIATLHELMPNGELRFRLVDRNGLGYVRVQSDSRGGWQNSHFHLHMSETYIVQKGWIGVALLMADKRIQIRVFHEQAIWTAPVGAPHNIYMPAFAVVHVVKHGAGSTDDWKTSEESRLLDTLSKPLAETEIVKMGSASG